MPTKEHNHTASVFAMESNAACRMESLRARHNLISALMSAPGIQLSIKTMTPISALGWVGGRWHPSKHFQLSDGVIA